MAAFEMLIKDHEKTKRALQQIVRQGDGKSLEKLPQIIEELQLHMQIEEQVLYPAAEKKRELKDLVSEAYSEHNEAKQVAKKLMKYETLDESECLEYIDQLIELVNHHVEEEESEFFPKAEKAFGKEEIGRITEALEQARKVGLSRSSR